jgi:hypothetical protein
MARGDVVEFAGVAGRGAFVVEDRNASTGSLQSSPLNDES